MTKALAEIDAATDAYHAIACISDLFAALRTASGNELPATKTQLRALIDLVHAEYERRAQAALATLALM